jgi:hypothetical protein
MPALRWIRAGTDRIQTKRQAFQLTSRRVQTVHQVATVASSTTNTHAAWMA